MANVLVEETSLSNIASAIREKNGGSATYKPSEMATAILNIQGDNTVTWEGNKMCIDFTLPSNITNINNSLYVPSNYTQQLFYMRSNQVTNISSSIFSNAPVIGFEFPNLNAIGDSAFSNCKISRPITIYSVCSVSNNAFQNTNVPAIDFKTNATFGTYIFHGCYKLNTIILRNPNMIPLSQSYFLGGTLLSNCYIYVPADLVNEYKAATNWTMYSNKFRAIEDYPEITGGAN